MSVIQGWIQDFRYFNFLPSPTKGKHQLWLVDDRLLPLGVYVFPNSWGLPPRCLQRWGWWAAGGRDCLGVHHGKFSSKKRCLQSRLKMKCRMVFRAVFLFFIGGNNGFQSCFRNMLLCVLSWVLSAGSGSCNRNSATNNCGWGAWEW